jgi:hypothetical protein
MKKLLCIVLLLSYQSAVLSMFNARAFSYRSPSVKMQISNNKQYISRAITYTKAEQVIKDVPTKKDRLYLWQFLDHKKNEYNKLRMDKKSISIAAQIRAIFFSAYMEESKPVSNAIIELNNVVHEEFLKQIKIRSEDALYYLSSEQKEKMTDIAESSDIDAILGLEKQDLLYTLIAQKTVEKCLKELEMCQDK